MNVNRLSESQFGPSKPALSGWDHPAPTGTSTIRNPDQSDDILSANWSGAPPANEWLKTAWDAIRRQPLAILGAALAGGVLLGVLIKRR